LGREDPLPNTQPSKCSHSPNALPSQCSTLPNAPCSTLPSCLPPDSPPLLSSSFPSPYCSAFVSVLVHFVFHCQGHFVIMRTVKESKQNISLMMKKINEVNYFIFTYHTLVFVSLSP